MCGTTMLIAKQLRSDFNFSRRHYRFKNRRAFKASRLSMFKNGIRTIAEVPSNFQTILLQFMRLFKRDIGSMTLAERIFRIMLSLFLLALSKASSLTTPLLFRKLIDHGFLNKNIEGLNYNAQATIFGLVVGLGISRIVSAFIQLFGELILSPATTSAAVVLPAEAFSSALSSASKRSDAGSIQKSAIMPYDNKKSQSNEIDSRSGFARRSLDRGLKASNLLIYRAIFNLLPALVESIAVLSLMCYKAGRNVGIASAIIAFSFVTFSGIAMNMRLPILRENLNAQGTANNCAEEALSLAETVAAFGTSQTEERRYETALNIVGKTYMNVRYSFSLLKLLQNALLGLGFSAVTYVTIRSYSASNIVEGVDRESLASRLVLVQALFAQLCAPLDQVGQNIRDCLSSAEDMRELEDLKLSGCYPNSNNDKLILSEKTDHTTPKLSKLPLLPLLQSVMSNPVTGQLPPILEVRNITFRYPSIELLNANKKPILKDISLVLPTPGYSIGIVGPSGSGKSTLLRLLVGLENVNRKGSILLEGYDVSKLNRFQIFCLVGQENDLFGSLSLVENIRYGIEIIKLVSPEEDREALTAAVEEARLESVLARIDGGLNAAVGPRGRLLSGGERQRVCLARALYRQRIGRGILLLDEATSALDAQTEQMVVNAIMGRVSKGAAAIMISHKLASVQRCDEIIVLRDGAVIQRGSHSQLVEEEGWYADAWQLQSQGKEKNSSLNGSFLSSSVFGDESEGDV